MLEERIRLSQLRDRIVTAEQAASLIHDGMTVGMSGFGAAGDCKAVPLALAARAREQSLRITLMTGASVGYEVDGVLAEAGAISRRMPFQSDKSLRNQINAGEAMFMDLHLSEMAEQLRDGFLGPVDVAVIEAVAVGEAGIVPTMSVGNSAVFAALAKQVIVEINLDMPLELEGLHDVYLPLSRPDREPIPLTNAAQRIGLPYIPLDPTKIAAIVVTRKGDSPNKVLPPDADTTQIAGHLSGFFSHEVRAGRLGSSLQPLQAGVGSIANAVLHGLVDSGFSGLRMYSEVLQDGAIELLDAGCVDFACASAIMLSSEYQTRFFEGLDRYRSRVLLRPQEISNHPEVIRRLGVIAVNTALECDIYGNVNSTHVGGTHMMNGIGGSGDFARNAYLSVFVTKSLAKDGDISSIVPMVSHVDHIGQDIDVIVTEHGLADLRGLAPRERAQQIITHCADPLYRDALRDYVAKAGARGGQTPHLIEEALAWHAHYRERHSMRLIQTSPPASQPIPEPA
ncbi:succinate CoA transferase family protein [Paraburkholderia xenovorans LB400]|uniref:Acetyl-CoA hydrolase n=1 Tax=Paraburkholderia xenovorans (strain LB400) TaxID=266265 RepID=Q13JT5_PARXL|nr:succinate CoA transferase [Paraburkholderia xenovorans]ABE35654.1 Acetyl-CoA hydrolase [Paraburkholderia xenovorans LB400]AIP35795.1 succinate CoA transferase family protein [Paraburkholderia xenovorans LB400]